MHHTKFCSIIGSLLVACVHAGTVTYDWDITWVNAAPDGTARPVIGINGAWPCPAMEASAGDTVVVKINNQLGNETVGLHFHGIDQVSTNWMDGPSGVTQCPVPPGSSMTYTFLADKPGTFWYHSHNMGQYPDGLRGAFIVHDPNDPYAGKYDEEVTVTVSDWYHQESITLVQNMLTTTNTNFRPPPPNGILINEGAGLNLTFVKGKTYRFRVISFSAFAGVMLHFDSHTLQVIMQDGSYVQQKQAYQLRFGAAQRYDFLVEAIDRDHRNYPILFALDMNPDYANDVRAGWPLNYTGYLVMEPDGEYRQDVVSVWRPLDDGHLVPLDGAAALGPVTQTIVLDFAFCRDVNNLPRACFNDKVYIPQKVPTLYSVSTTGNDNTNPDIYGAVQPYILSRGDIVELVVNNLNDAIHPFHLHGHQFQVIDRPGRGSGKWSGRHKYGTTPPRKDTLSINANSFGVMRFEVDNPGVFLFHCHIEWHVEMGMTITLIQEPDKLRNVTYPQDHIDNCKKMGIPYQGNAAGNTVDVLDTSGFITVPPETYTGALYEPTATPRVRDRKLRGSKPYPL